MALLLLLLRLLLLLLVVPYDQPHKTDAEGKEKNAEKDEARRIALLGRNVGDRNLGVRGAIKEKKEQSGKESGHDEPRLLDNDNELLLDYALQLYKC
jgi:hypothetical protein